MSIKYNNQTIYKRIINWREVVKTMLNGVQIRPSAEEDEYILFVESADYLWKLYIYACTLDFYPFNERTDPFDWQVSIDDWPFERYTGTVRADNTGVIEVGSWYQPDSNHTILIKPTTIWYGWAKAFGTWARWNNINQIIHDSPYMWYWDSATNTWDFFRMYQWCQSSVTSAPAEVLPSTVTTIGNYFRFWQYAGCALTSIPAEVMPNSVTSIGDEFRASQYIGNPIITPAVEVLSNNLVSIWNSFRDEMYSDCTNLTTWATEVIPSSVTSIWYRFRESQYDGCTSLTSTPDEVYPNNVGIGQMYRSYQYARCPNLISAKMMANRWYNNYRNRQFRNTNANIVVTIGWNVVDTWLTMSQWGWIWLPTGCTIYVPSSLLSAYQQEYSYYTFIWY